MSKNIVDLDIYPSNSRKSTLKEKEEPDKKLDKVVSGSTKTKKKSGITKLTDVFLSEDVSNVKSYIILDVVIPGIKRAISDVVDILLYGDSGRSKSRSSASKISYRNFYDKDDRRNRESSPSRTRNGFDYDDIIFDTRGDADAVLAAMEGVIDQFGVVSVGDLYDLADISTQNYAINKYGWTDLHTAQVVRAKDGYMLKLPRAMPLN